MDSFLRDLRYATRGLLRTPGFFAVAVLTLALGIGATTAIFSVIDGVLLRPLPYPDAERIVQLWQVGEKGGHGQVSDPNFEDWRTQTRSFAAMAEFNSGGVVSITGVGEPVRARAADVSRGFFEVLGVQPEGGRLFTDDEMRLGAAPAVIVSHRFGQQQLGGGRAALGRTLAFGDRTYTVVGVMPAWVDFPAGVDLWTPRELEPINTHRTGHNWRAIARVKDGVSVAMAQAEISAVSKRLKQQYGDETWMADAAAVPLREQMVGPVRPALLVLLAASAVLLLIACANVVNLLVARMAVRQGEVALRMALGAGRARLVRHFLVESLVVALAGGILGLTLAALGVRTLLALEPGNLPRVGEVRLSWEVLLFAFGVSVATAAAMGLLTALRGTRSNLREMMADSQRTQSAGGSYRVRSTLVVAQVALTMVLLVGAGLLARSFVRLLDVDPGFRRDRLVVLDVSLPYSNEPAAMAQNVRFFDDVIGRVRTLPGVREVGGINTFPLAGGFAADGTFLVMSRPDEPIDMSRIPELMRAPTRSGHANFRIASGGYFRAMNVPLLSGRLFDDRDAPEAPHVAVISQSLARKQFGGEDPIGKIIQFGNMDGDLRPFTVIGVVGDVREESLADEPRPTFYATYRQRPRQAATFNIVVQGEAPEASIIAAARQAVRELRPDVPPRFRTIETVIASSVSDRRFMLVLIGVFGVTALLLAMLGVYSVIAFLVAQRRQEMSIRIALGAQSGDVLQLVLRQGLALALVGIAVGAGASFAATRLIQGFLFGVSAADPVAFVGVVVLLALVALVASLVPARRATRVAPMEALRGS
jgi:putative ABC transport system permease protein